MGKPISSGVEFNRGDYVRLSTDSFSSTASTAYSDTSITAKGSVSAPVKPSARGWLSKKIQDFKKSLEHSESTLVKGGGIASKSWNFFDLISRSKSNNRKEYTSFIGDGFKLQKHEEANYDHVHKGLKDVEGESATDIGVMAQKKAMASWRAESENLIGKIENPSLQGILKSAVWDAAAINDPVHCFFGAETTQNTEFHRALNDELKDMRDKGLQGEHLTMLTYALSNTSKANLEVAVGALAYFKKNDFVDSIKNVGRTGKDHKSIPELDENQKTAARAAWQMAQSLALSKDGMDALIFAMKSCTRADGNPGIIISADERPIVQVFLQAANRSRDCGWPRDLPSEFSSARKNYEKKLEHKNESIQACIEANKNKKNRSSRIVVTPHESDVGKSLDVLVKERDAIEAKIKRNPKLLYDGMLVAAKRLEIYSKKFTMNQDGTLNDIRVRITHNEDDVAARKNQGIVVGDLDRKESDGVLFSKEERYAYAAIRCGFNEDTPSSDLAKADRQTFKFTYKWIPRFLGTRVRDIVAVVSSPYEKAKRLIYALRGKDTDAKVTYKIEAKHNDSFNLFRKNPLRGLKKKVLERATLENIGEQRAAKEALSNFAQNAPKLIKQRITQKYLYDGKSAPIALPESEKQALLEDCVRAGMLSIFNATNHKFYKTLNGKQLNSLGMGAAEKNILALLQSDEFKSAPEASLTSQSLKNTNSAAPSSVASSYDGINKPHPAFPDEFRPTNIAADFVTEMYQAFNQSLNDNKLDIAPLDLPIKEEPITIPVLTKTPDSKEPQPPLPIELPFGITEKEFSAELAKYKNMYITPALLEDWAQQMIKRVPGAPVWADHEDFDKNLKLANGKPVNFNQLSEVRDGSEAGGRDKLASIFTKYLHRAELTTITKLKSGWGRGVTLRNPGAFAFSVLSNKTVVPVQPSLNAAFVQTVQSTFEMGLVASGGYVSIGKQRSYLKQFGAGLFVGVRNALTGYGISAGASVGASRTKDLSHMENVVFRMDRLGREAKPDVNGVMVKKRLPTLDGDAEVMQEVAKVVEIIVKGVGDDEIEAGWTPLKEAMADHWDDLSVKYVNPEQDQEIARRTTYAARAGVVADFGVTGRLGATLGVMHDRRTLQPEEQFHRETTEAGVGVTSNKTLKDERTSLVANIGLSEAKPLGKIGTTGVTEGTMGTDGSYAIDVRRTGVFVRSNIVTVNGEVQPSSYVTTHYENAKLYIDTLMGSTCTKVINTAVNERLKDKIKNLEAEIKGSINDDSVNKKKDALQSINKVTRLRIKAHQLQTALRMREKLQPIDANIAQIEELVEPIEEKIENIKGQIASIQESIANIVVNNKKAGTATQGAAEKIQAQKNKIAELKAQKLKLDVELLPHNSKLKTLQTQKVGSLLRLEMTRQGDTILQLAKQERRNLLRVIVPNSEGYDKEISKLETEKKNLTENKKQFPQDQQKRLDDLKQKNKKYGRIISLIKNLAVFDNALSGLKFDPKEELERAAEEVADYFDRVEKDAHPTQNFVEYAQLPPPVANVVNKHRAKAKIAEASGDFDKAVQYSAEADRILRTPEAWVTDFLLVMGTSYDTSKVGATLFAMANKQESTETSNVRSYVVAVKSNFVKPEP